MNLSKTLKGALIASAVALGATSTSAAVIDFTAGGVNPVGTVLGVGYTVTAVGGPLTATPYDGGNPLPTNSFGLAFVADGYGVTDDEITTPAIPTRRRPVESITVTFASSVKIVGFAFLDLFQQIGELGEVGVMSYAGGDVELSFDPANAANGYAEVTGLDIRTKSVTFTVERTNDLRGFADGALAAIQVAAVPVPAAGLMLLGGLGGLAALRRRRKA